MPFLSGPATGGALVTSGANAPSTLAIGTIYYQVDTNGRAQFEWIGTSGGPVIIGDLTDVALYGTGAQRPAATTVTDGTLYSVTDSATVTTGLYQAQNSAWVAISAASGGGAPTGAAGGDLAGTYPNPTLKASIALTGNPTVPTQTQGNNSTRAASTAYVDTAVAGVSGGSGTVITPTALSVLPTNAKGQTIPWPMAVTSVGPTSGVMRMTNGLYLKAGVALTNINLMPSGTTTSPTAQWLAVYDQSMTIVATTEDLTTAAITGNTLKTWRFVTTPGGATVGTWTPSADGFYWVGIVIVATTVGSFYGMSASSTVANLAQKLSGGSTTTYTTPSTTAPGTISGGGALYWAYVT